MGLVKLAAARRLRAAIPPILARACYGDPVDRMRTLLPAFEAIMDPDWSALADICMEAARSERLGTVLWSVAQLSMLDDERARPLLTRWADFGDKFIAPYARTGLDRLNRKRP
jgi:hypothetical protein